MTGDMCNEPLDAKVHRGKQKRARKIHMAIAKDELVVCACFIHVVAMGDRLMFFFCKVRKVKKEAGTNSFKT